MEIDGETACRLAAIGGLELDRTRGERVAPFVSDALRGAFALARLDMGDAGAAGPPWGGDVPDA
ncbi:hypothetical protein [Ferruginivarius sediminum]|uniref:Uncharacterized protein n=1 Tax=Ferruginivarius sediminum TaxID=2661937 RepID=A0A369TA86_9PROT|nr:hypothetical protein [Ferruginivarius sediminum]RDD61087.1 hypothetical protein DRB17_14395 [Ferruginivarius sediminum]